MKIGITADSSSGLEYAPFEHHIKITKTVISFGDQEYIDGVDIKAEEFYEKLKSTDIVPSTSAPTLGEIVSQVNEWKKEGCTDVIHFPISFNLSDYGKNLTRNLSDLITGINFHVIDSNSACLMEGCLAKYAEELAKRDYDIETIKTEIEKMKKNTTAYFVVDDLKYLVKNGRLNSISGFIGSMTKIKPVLNLGANGKIETVDKVRTYNKAITRIVDLISKEYEGYQNVVYIVLHTGDLDRANDTKKELMKSVKNIQHVLVTTITPTVGAHIGAGVIGIGAIATDNLMKFK